MSASSTESSTVAPASSRANFYKTLLSALSSQLSHAPSRDPFAVLSNVAALIYHSMHTQFGRSTSVNWSGFYLMRNASPAEAGASPTPVLLLGPFHGLPAVSVIKVGRGVCGTAVAERVSQVVPDVHAHPNHIACDSASQSEIVVPIFADAERKQLVGVLDIDSPVLNFFSEEDRVEFEKLTVAVGNHIDWKCLDAPIQITIPEEDTCSMSKPIKKVH